MAAAAARAAAGRSSAAAAAPRGPARPPPPPPMCSQASSLTQQQQQCHHQRRRMQQRLRAASVELDFDALSSVDIESIAYSDGCYSVQGCLLSPASPERVYQLLTDYEALPRVFHNIKSSSVRRDAATGGKQLVQTCKWAFLVFSGTFETELRVTEDAAQRQLTFSLIESAFMREFVGSWDVRPGAGGLTEVRHRLSVRPSLAPPQKVGDLTKKVFKRQVESILGDLSAELARTCAADASLSS